MRAHRSEQSRVKESHAERAIASHGDSANAAGFAGGGNAVTILDPRHEFPQEEIVITEARVMRVHEETGVTSRADHDEIANLAAVPELLEKIEASGTHKHLLIITEPMEVIEHGIAAVGVFPIAGRQDHTVRNGTPQDAAGHGKAFTAGVCGWEWSRRPERAYRQQTHAEGNQGGSDPVKLYRSSHGYPAVAAFYREV